MADYIYREDGQARGTSLIAAAFLGAIVGAVSASVAIALSNPKNRQRIQETVKGGQEWVGNTVHSLERNGQAIGDSVMERVDEVTHSKPVAEVKPSKRVSK